jgi:hypothetical protein
VVHDELNHQVSEYNEDEQQPALPGKEINTQEDASEQGIDEGLGDS